MTDKPANRLKLRRQISEAITNLQPPRVADVIASPRASAKPLRGRLMSLDNHGRPGPAPQCRNQRCRRAPYHVSPQQSPPHTSRHDRARRARHRTVYRGSRFIVVQIQLQGPIYQRRAFRPAGRQNRVVGSRRGGARCPPCRSFSSLPDDTAAFGRPYRIEGLCEKKIDTVAAFALS